MKHIKSWLSATAAVTVMAAIAGVVYATHPKNAASPKQAATYAWYDLDPTADPSTANQELMTGTPGTPPPATGGCAQLNTSGQFCKVLLRSESGISEFPEVDPGTTVSDLISSSSGDLSIATDNPAEDQNTDGYARQPNP